MPHLFIFGLGYTAARFARRMRADGWTIAATGRAGDLDFADSAAVHRALSASTHILSSVPPDTETGADPVIERFGNAIAASRAQWVGYISSTGVYGDTAGAWVDESAPTGTGRRLARAAADCAWQALHPAARLFRLPGIYGPGRSALDRVRNGRAHRIDLPGQIFSRIHVDDITGGLIASLDGPPGIYNLADDLPCHQNDVIEAACALLGQPLPPLLSLDDAGLSPMGRGFYGENRRIANNRAKRQLGWRLLYPDYRAGLQACMASD